MALPFLLGETSVADYLERSKLTGAGRNGIAGAAPFWDYLASEWSYTIFWSWINEDTFYDKALFSDRVKLCILVANVWHFFFRKWCWP